jgi:hypothetical protein
MTQDDRPTVRFTLGDGIEQLLAASSYPFEIVELHDMDLVPVTRVVRCAYARSPGAFELPEAALVALSFRAGKITAARVCPHAGALDERGAGLVAEEVAARVEGAGWRRVPGLGLEVSAVSRELSDPARPTDTTLLVGKWLYGDDAVLLEVDRSGSAAPRGEPLPPPTCLVRVRLENAPLTKRAIDEIKGNGRNVIWRKGAP